MWLIIGSYSFNLEAHEWLSLVTVHGPCILNGLVDDENAHTTFIELHEAAMIVTYPVLTEEDLSDLEGYIEGFEKAFVAWLPPDEMWNYPYAT